MSEAKFPLGQTLITTNAWNTLDAESIFFALGRHVRGDWGDVGLEDHASNEQALKRGSRLFSVYHDKAGTKFWIITEADRSATTILLPEDY